MLRTLLLIGVFVQLLFALTPFEEANEAYAAGRYEEACAKFKQLAKDDGESAYLLAVMYENGQGCEKNLEEADKWYKISSKLYYKQEQYDVTSRLDKEKKRIFESLDKPSDEQTQYTIRQYTQSFFNLKAHNTNYFMPVSHRYNGKYASTDGHHALETETEFQISLKFDIASNLLGLGEIYSFGYTQRSFWQLYVPSAYFRESNYNPEFFITIPTAQINYVKFIKAIKLSIEHQSNGRGGEQERSWNYLSGGISFQYKNLFTELNLWYRLPDATDYNPDLIDYIGNGNLSFLLPYKKNLLKLVLRNNFKDHGSIEFSHSYPFFGRDDLFFYTKIFSGYDESLIDYNNYVNKIGIGLSMSR